MCVVPRPFLQQIETNGYTVLLHTHIVALEDTKNIGQDALPFPMSACKNWLYKVKLPRNELCKTCVSWSNDAISHMLRLDRGRRWTPLYMRTDDGEVLAQPWAAGFMFAVKRWPEAWRPMFERGDQTALMLPILACAEVEEVEKLLAGQPAEMREHIGRAYHHIPEAVCAIRDYWRAQRAAGQSGR